MGISRRRRWDWHPNVFHVVGIGILLLLSVGVIQVAESGGRTTAVSFDEALAEFRGAAEAQPDLEPPLEPDGDPREVEAGEPAPAAPAPDPEPEREPRPVPEPAPDEEADVQEADVRAEQPDQPAAFQPPTPGVYRYRATGGEWLNMPGANRTYPEESYATVRARGDCRWDFEHRVAQEHVDERAYCSNPGEFLFVGGETRVTFFGQSDGTKISCDPPAIVVRIGDEPGATHSSTCSGDDGTETAETTTYLGRETLEIGGVAVVAYHIRFEAEISGRATGRSDSKVWLHPDTGLMLRVERQTDTTTNAFGGSVRYQEEATFELADLDPRT